MIPDCVSPPGIIINNFMSFGRPPLGPRLLAQKSPPSDRAWLALPSYQQTLRAECFSHILFYSPAQYKSFTSSLDKNQAGGYQTRREATPDSLLFLHGRGLCLSRRRAEAGLERPMTRFQAEFGDIPHTVSIMPRILPSNECASDQGLCGKLAALPMSCFELMCSLSTILQK